jgi:hypothetical protein
VRRAGAASGSNESAMSEKPRRYLAYLLRLWQASRGGELVWRASLEDPHAGGRRGFASLAELIAFLEEETTGSPGAEAPPDTEEHKPRR